MDQTPESLIPYARWTEEALRRIAADALGHVSRSGLPGEHHFYITVRTTFPGVDIPRSLLAQYPQEMTIVLQHQYRNLRVEADFFSVVLFFGGAPTTLVIPFASITKFADPHARFSLEFDVPDAPPPRQKALPGPAKQEPETGQVVSLADFRRRPSQRTATSIGPDDREPA